MDWVTDPKAIDSIIVIGELRPGDEVIITGGANYRLNDLNDQVVTIKADAEKYVGKYNAIDAAPWSTEQVVAQIIHPQSNGGIFIICRKNIAAWRRPSARKE
jgi:hypothetical protein